MIFVLKTLRWQFCTTSVLALVCASLAGAWLAASPSHTPRGTEASLARSLPRSEAGSSSPAQAIDAQKQAALAEQARLQALREQRELALTQLTKQVAEKSAAQMSARTGPAMPEEQEVLRLRTQTPRWVDLNLPQAEMEAVTLAWNARKDVDVQPAIASLTASREHWKKEAVKAATTSANDRTARQRMLQEMKDRFQRESGEALAVLRMDDLAKDTTDPFLEAVKKLFMVEGSRAIVGENFTNSVGIEMVWVPEGGFWMGRTEVTSAAFNAVMRGGGGGDEPAEGISWGTASSFCQKLTTVEVDDISTLAENARQMPLNTEYSLPHVKQWRLAREQAESLGMSGFSDGLSEWSADTYASGLAQNQTLLNGVPIQGSWQLALKGNTADPLPGALTGSWVSRTADTKARKGGTVTAWSGRLGFRVILIPPKAP